MPRRIQGADAVAALGREATYGVPPEASGAPPNANFYRMPFVSSTLGAEQALEPDDLLGRGGNPYDPDYAAVRAGGEIVVPVDLYNFGHWLRLAFGPPVTAASVAAQAIITFTAQPATNSTMTLNGTVWTFVAGAPTGTQIQKGVDLAATLTAAATALNASADAETAKNTYVAGATTLTATNDTLGPAGNAYTVALSANANGKVKGNAGTLKGGANSHTWTIVAGADPLSACLEIGFPTKNKYRMQTGLAVNTISIPVQQDTTKLNATITLMQQNEWPAAAASLAGAPNELQTVRFSQFSGKITCAGDPLGEIRSSTYTITKNLEEDRIVREDGLSNGVDAGKWAQTGEYVVRYSEDSTLEDLVAAKVPFESSWGWSRERGQSLIFTSRRVYLPQPKLPVTGAQGLQATYGYEAAYDLVTSEIGNVILTNDLAGSVYA